MTVARTHSGNSWETVCRHWQFSEETSWSYKGHTLFLIPGEAEDETHLTAHRVSKDTGRDSTRHAALRGKDNPNY